MTPDNPEAKPSLWRAGLTVIGVLFLFGIAMGSCTLGAYLPIALFNLATGHQ